jgi:hypothetical protein
MTVNEAAILEKLTLAWAPPRAFGGTDKSQHAKIAARMIPKGWLERQARPAGSYVYRITDKGALANHSQMSGLAMRLGLTGL